MHSSTTSLANPYCAARDLVPTICQLAYEPPRNLSLSGQAKTQQLRSPQSADKLIVPYSALAQLL